MAIQIKPETRQALQSGLVIPACPLALNAQRQLDERRQRALVRYYIAAGAGGLAVGVHTTQFSIRNPKVGLFRPVLELAGEKLGLAPTGSAASHFPEDTVGGNVRRHSSPAAVELGELPRPRSAEFIPLPADSREPGGSALKSALINSTGV